MIQSYLSGKSLETKLEEPNCNGEEEQLSQANTNHQGSDRCTVYNQLSCSQHFYSDHNSDFKSKRTLLMKGLTT